MNENTKDTTGMENTTEETTKADGELQISTETEEVDVKAFAEIISEKDKKLESLQQQIDELKKTNANMLLQINSGHSDDFDIDKAILSCDTRVIK